MKRGNSSTLFPRCRISISKNPCRVTALSLLKVMWRFQPAFELDFSAPFVSELQPCVSLEVLGERCDSF